MTSEHDMDGPHPRGGTTAPWLVALAIGVVVAVVAAAVVILGRGGTPDPAEAVVRQAQTSTTVIPSSTTSTSTTSTTTTTLDPPPTTVPDGYVDDTGAVVTVGEVTVVIPPGSLDGPGVITVEAATPGWLDQGFALAGPVFDISIVDAEVVGPITITLPIDDLVGVDPVVLADGSTIDELPSVVMAHWVAGSWEVLDTTVDHRSRTITATTSSLSLFGGIRIVGGFVVDVATSLVEALTGGLYRNVGQPECGAGEDDRSSWRADSDDPPVRWCANRRDDETRVVQVVNQRRYAITVSAPAGTISASTTDLASQLSGFTTRPGVVALGPGDVATIAFAAGATAATVTSEYDGLAQSITSLLVAADVLAAIAARVPFSGATEAVEFLRVLDLAGCVTALGIDVTAAVANAASTIAALVRSCFDGVLRDALGWVGRIMLTPLVVVASTVAYFLSSGSALWDLLTGGSRGRLVLGAGSGVDPDRDEEASAGGATSTDRPVVSGWPTGDREGPHTLYAYLGADLTLPEWISCSANYCIVGTGDRVRLFDLSSGIRDLGWLGVDHPDPVAAFVEAGIPAGEVNDFMTPGRVPGGR